MTPERWQRVQELFREAAGRSREERGSFVKDACGDDAELRAEVESLLACDAEASVDFMRPPVRRSGTDLDRGPDGPDPLIGVRISRYQIKGVIGTGGMGTVYEAQQDYPRRAIALKVMRSGVTSRSALRHFERESEILARLTHPNIAQVYEAGTHTDAWAGGAEVPYFAMEYIAGGRPIGRYAEEKQLGVRDRLGLFAQVCDAVHHGHQKGIIHRDLKPGNILVDSAGFVKVIDFGVARSTDSDVAVTTMQTDVGQLVGTLQYMSPEQCDADPRDLDMRSDVYSLGVVLYELLTGELPYETSGSTIYRAVRVVKESVPRRPSSIDRKLRGDVELLVLKALEKDREKRYQSAADFARDVRRYLNGEPVEAKTPNAWTRALRWLGRHPVITTTAACLAVTVVVISTTFISARLINARPHAISLSKDHQEAWLLSVAGTRLHPWTTAAPRGIKIAELAERPAEFGRGKLALIGYSAALSNPFPGSLCAFDVGRSLEEPVWRRRIEVDDIPPGLVNRGLNADAFGVYWCMIADVFPERPGDEIVALHSRGPEASCAVRVYDLRGDVLYQIWHNGLLTGGYFMSGAGLLVFTGYNSVATWDQRGHPDVEAPYPVVVFAVRPVLGLIGSDYFVSAPGEDPQNALWYQCLYPPNVLDFVQRWDLGAPLYKHDAGEFVYLELEVRMKAWDRTTGVRWVLDRNGQEVPGSRIVEARYGRDGTLPDPDLFRLAPLPPIVSDSDVVGPSN